MNLEKIIFAFFIIFAATLNFGFIIGEIDNPLHHHVWEFFAAFVKKGYAGYASYEAPNPTAWKRPAEDVAREALAAARAVLP